MHASSITSLVVASELRVNRVGPRGVRLPPVVSRFGPDAAPSRSASSRVVRRRPLRRLGAAVGG